MPEQAIDKVVGEFAEEQNAHSVDRDSSEIQDEIDEITGASPGTAQACNDLGLNSLQANLKKFGIKPPGVV